MNHVIILAGGKGERMGRGGVPKQFVELAGTPIIIYSMKSAELNRNIDEICVVCPADSHMQVRKWSIGYGISKLKVIAEAGADRQQSVHNGLKSINAKKSDVVMVMTAVCPFVSQTTIDRHFEAMKECDACITVVKATDAITFSNDGKTVNRTLQKKKIFIQQGPQSYRYGVIKLGHEMYEEDESRTEVNEDSELVLNMGVEAQMILGDRFCVKVTYPEDLAIAEALREIFEKKEIALQKLQAFDLL
jgi:2-C-methyl-D-erythritol 4-phosphate cytidylyltransferase